MNNESKPIGKGDDECKEFIIESLNGADTHGFDIDSIYYANNKWIVFEYLKCDSEWVTPHTSSPSRYPKNWKKFYSLYVAAKKLDADLILVNYSNVPKYKDMVKIMKVLSFDMDKINEYSEAPNPKPKRLDYMTFEEKKMTRQEFGNYLRQINSKAALPPWVQEKNS